MIKFLISRPIAVTMTFIAILALGIFATTRLPVSLMPDIDIPRITVQVGAKNMPAREIENTVIKMLRLQLMQSTHLSDISSETRDGAGLIKLEFDYGADIDYAYIEVNEKIDRAMTYLPRNIERPRVIKASATDLPVFYLNLTVKQSDKQTIKPSNHQIIKLLNELFPVPQDFIDLSNFAGQVIRKRIEQLPEVAMADISGQVFPELLIIPDMKKLDGLGITNSDIEKSLNENNIDFGNLVIHDGQYQYNVRFANNLSTKKDIANMFLKNKDRIFQLKDVAEIIEHPQKRKGMVLSDGKDAVTIAVIKQSDARMQTLKKELHNLVNAFMTDYPDIEFTITRDQTALLDYSMSNLAQSLIIGALLAFIVMFFFLKDYKSPLLIGISVPASLIVSMLLFHVVGISLNIISLSGLVLGVGMMVDNSIIVIDNITQHRKMGGHISQACINGTNEVFRPMLSSVLTTCAVFLPLIFISGITGSLFYDQAMAVTIGLFVSLAVAIAILPVYYRLFYINGKPEPVGGFLARANRLDYEGLYEKGFRFTMRNQGLVWMIILLMVTGTFILYFSLKKEKLPALAKSETMLKINWNEKITPDENKIRVNELISHLHGIISQNTCLIGEQQFLLDQNSAASGQEALIYLNAGTQENLRKVQSVTTSYIESEYNHALYTFEDPGNVFNMIFSDNEPPLKVRLRSTADFGENRNIILQTTVTRLQEQFPEFHIKPVSWEEYIVLKADPEILSLYDININDVYTSLKRSFRENEVLLITDNQNYIPVILGEKPQTISNILSEAVLINDKGKEIRLTNLLRQDKDIELKTIIAGQEGEYFPVLIDIPDKAIPVTMEKIRKILSENKQFEAGFSGKFFTNKELLKELVLILCISLALLYFILASQFESLTLPLIVLIEVPIDIFAAFLFLKLGGSGINLMSMIGIVVMSGIVINDSILKVDTVNQLVNQGSPLLKALVIAGRRRLKPILMTSLTTILALLPFLFIRGMGSDLQKPLALVMVGGMTLGTIVSLYFIPLCYYYLKKNSYK